MAENETRTPQQRFEAATVKGVPQIYFNGFVNSLTIGDVVTLLERNGEPVALLNMSYTVAKTLAGSLGQIISSLEESTGRTMLTTHDVEQSSVPPERKQ